MSEPMTLAEMSKVVGRARQRYSELRAQLAEAIDERDRLRVREALRAIRDGDSNPDPRVRQEIARCLGLSPQDTEDINAGPMQWFALPAIRGAIADLRAQLAEAQRMLASREDQLANLQQAEAERDEARAILAKWDKDYNEEVERRLQAEAERDRLRPPEGCVHVVVAEALLPKLAEWSEPVQMRVERREGQRIDLVFRRLDAALRETEGE